MFWRSIRSWELADCLAVDPHHLGSEIVGQTKAFRAWRSLFGRTSFNCAAIEADPPIKNARIVGFGSSLFVSPAFVDKEIANPRAGLNARIVRAIDAGKSIFLSDSELRVSNASRDLDLVVLCCCWRQELDVEQRSEVQMLLSASFLHHHAGYGLRRLLAESIGQEERNFLLKSRIWRNMNAATHLRPEHRNDRSLWLITRRDALASPGSIIGMLFYHREPALRLHVTDQQLLLAALDGLTDQELSQCLGITVAAIKRRWLCLYDRIANTCPDLLAGLGGEGCDHKRGRQKRHRIVAFVRQHPEELRPNAAK